MQSLSSLTSLLRNKTREDYSSESTLVEQGGENLLLSIGNVLNSAAQKASVIGKAKFSKDVRAKVINVMRGVAHCGYAMIVELIVCLTIVTIGSWIATFRLLHCWSSSGDGVDWLCHYKLLGLKFQKLGCPRSNNTIPTRYQWGPPREKSRLNDKDRNASNIANHDAT